MLQAVIFDFDGVIADTEPLHFKAYNRILKGYGIKIAKKAYYRDYLGYTDHDCFEIIKKSHPDNLGKTSVKTLMQQKSAAYLDLLKDQSCVISHVAEFLQMLAANNLTIAICSGGLRNEIETVLLRARLHDFFEVIVTANEIKKGKPDPEGFNLALQLLNSRHQGKTIKAGDCVVVEDSHWGLDAAKAAGMHTVAVTNSYAADELATAEMVVDNLGQLAIEDLQKLCG
jgi:HAD superfamily hydrolase (TIGR01509 family)